MEEFKDWTTDQVVKFLRDKGLSDVAEKFQKKGVTGSRLATMNAGNLEEEFGIDDGLRNELVAKLLLQLFPSKTVQKTVFNDSVHGHIEVHPLLVKIINTPQFHRLRNIKQLGGKYFVFPGAAHNRFEHSIGTSHLAEKLVKSLQERQPELGITDKDVLCVSIAGLCHDLGHGPFSHMFDSRFIPAAVPGSDWQHETASVDMFDYLVVQNNLKQEFKNYGLEDQDMSFIKKLILGNTATQEGENTGRSEEKNFLYEIVANKTTGIDVDKWDYFARDCHNLGIKNSFDHNRYIKFTRVLEVEKGKWQICVRDKEAAGIYAMFYARLRLHQQACQHKTSNIIEMMICEALLKANDHLKIEGKDGTSKKMSEAIDDMEAYTKLTDHVYYQILYSTDPNLQPAKALIQRIEKRQLYKIIGQPTLLKTSKNKDDIFKEIEKIAKIPLKMEDETPLIIVDVVTFDYGKEEKYKNLRFYRKIKQSKAVDISADEVSHFLPNLFTEQQVRVYCRSDDDNFRNTVEKAFEEWCLKYNVAEHPQTQKRKLDVLLSDQGASHSTASNSESPSKQLKKP